MVRWFDKEEAIVYAASLQVLAWIIVKATCQFSDGAALCVTGKCLTIT